MNKEDIYREKYEQAHQRIKDLMEYENSIDILRSFWKIYHIEEYDQRCKLSFEIGCVLLGITHPKDFVHQLEKELGISLETARAIAKEVNDKIFAHVKDILIETYRLQDAQQKTASIQNETISKGYSTPPAMFEKKLQQSVLTASKQNTSAEKQAKDTVSSSIPKKDPYKELPE